MNKNGGKNHIDLLAGMLTFGIFAVGIIAVLLAGAGVYRRLTARDTEAYSSRICAEYITTKVRSAASADCVSVEQGPESTVLRIRETVNGTEYISSIYLYNGKITELYTPADYEPDYAAGESLIEAKWLSFSLNEGLLQANYVTAEGKAGQVLLCVKTEGGELIEK